MARVVGAAARNHRAQRSSQLTSRADDQDLLRLYRCHVGESWMRLVRLRQLRLLERNRPVDRQCLVGKIDEGVGVPCRRRPMIIDQIGVRRLIGQSLKGVADPARHEDRRLRTHLKCEAATEAGARAQIDPSTEDSSGRQRDQLVPRLGVNASGRAEPRS